MVPDPRGAEAGVVTEPPAMARRRHARRRWLPAGRPLSDRDVAWRHGLVCLVTLAHVPFLLAGSLLTGAGAAGAVALIGIAALLGVAVGPFQRLPRALAATASLLGCSLMLVRLFPERPELNGHLFVVVALVALYQNWSAFGLAVIAAAVANGPIRLMLTHDEAHPGAGWWAVLRAAFVLAEACVLTVFWRADEQARFGEEQLQAALWEGQDSVRARLEQTEQIRTDLIGTVSHEFRTPLTGIRGAALTLLKRGDRLDEEARKRLLEGVIDQQERLSRLLENMLTAARATAADPSAVAEVDGVAAEVAMLASAARPCSPSVAVTVPPGTVARIDRHALHQVLANLLDNAQQYGQPGSVPLIAGGREGTEVWVAVSNEGKPLDTTAATHLFEPFTQGEGGATRQHEGLGMGLYVVRRLIDVYGGHVTVRADGGWVTVELRLQAVGPKVVNLQEPTAVPIP